MPDTKVQMNVTLTDGTVINAGQFTVPEGPVGPAGQDGAAGADGVTPLQYNSVLTVAQIPATGGAIAPIPSNFNRTPVVGEVCLYNVYEPSSKRFFLVKATLTTVASMTSSANINTVNEYGIGIKSVAITEVA